LGEEGELLEKEREVREEMDGEREDGKKDRGRG